MATVTNQDLHGLVTNALERMAFVFTEQSVLSPGEALSQSVAHALVELTGSARYAITVSATPGMIQEVASGMMGCDPQDVDVRVHGRAMVAEMANVLGGELIMQMREAAKSLQIGLPRDLTDREASSYYDQAAMGGVVCVVDCDDGSLLVTFTGL